MKRILSGILCLLMVLMLTPALMRTADAATSGKCGKNLTWSYDRKTATLTIKGSGKMYDYRECGPWREHNIICEVKLPKGLTSIGAYAFMDLHIRNPITIPDTVRTIGEGAFSGGGLIAITIPEGVKKIGAYAFKECGNLRWISIPDSVTSIGEGIFYKAGVKAVRFGDGITEIPSLTFAYTNLETLTVGRNLKKVDENAFFCNGLQTIYASDVDLKSRIAVAYFGNDSFRSAKWKSLKKTKPAILSNPTMADARAGDRTTFAVYAAGTGLTYQWYYRKTPDSKWIKIKNATSNIYVFRTKLSQNGYQYRCRVKNEKGTVYSKPANLEVRHAKPVIDTQPTAASVSIGNKVRFRVTAHDDYSDALRYQWYYRTSPKGKWKAIKDESAKTDKYCFVAEGKHDGYQYRCKVMNWRNHNYTDVVKLTIVPGKPVIRTQPKNVKVKPGESVRLKVQAEGADLSYQWYYRTSSGSAWKRVMSKLGKKAAYIFNATEAKNGYQYRCKISNTEGSVFSKTVTLTVRIPGKVLTGVCGSDLTWALDTGTGVMTIEGSGNLYFDGNPPWDGDRELIEELILPDGLTGIDGFSGCTGLTSVVLPDRVEIVADSAFEGCTALTAFTAGKGTCQIGDRAFAGCKKLTSVTLPYSGSSAFFLGNESFRGCTALKSIGFPEYVNGIGRYAFADCTSLASITIPNGWSSIDDHEFDGCTGLKTVIVPDHVLQILGGFEGCTGLTTLKLGSGLAAIRGFNGCTSLKTVTIPGSAKSVFGFENCTALETLVMQEGVLRIGGFSGCSSLKDVSLPKTLESMDWESFRDCTALEEFTIPDKVHELGMYVLSGCPSLEKITLGKGVLKIDMTAFTDCPHLTDVWYNGSEKDARDIGIFYHAELQDKTWHFAE